MGEVLAFTDDDLKRLKAFTERHALQPEYTVHTANGVMEALLARLEAAERTIIDLLILCDSTENKDAIMEATLPWRNSKAAGKE